MRGKLGLVLMGGAMLSKSLIQFSVDGWSCVPSLLFTWGQTMVAPKTSLVALMVKHLPIIWETQVSSLVMNKNVEWCILYAFGFLN